jgi:hypothetical protein
MAHALGGSIVTLGSRNEVGLDVTQSIGYAWMRWQMGDVVGARRWPAFTAYASRMACGAGLLVASDLQTLTNT